MARKTEHAAPEAANPRTRPHNNRTAVVTGATSGLGYAAAALLAEQGAELVLVTGRTAARAEEAARNLRTETGKDVFRGIELDLSDATSPRRAADAIDALGVSVDRLILNAGMVPGTGRQMTDEGFEMSIASSLVGHHRLTTRLLELGRLSADARVVISGSEAARGDLPTFTPLDLRTHAQKNFAGDLSAAAESVFTWDVGSKFKPGDVYATTKLFVAYWATELADRLPAGMAVNAVSPGSAPNTLAIRNANFFMKRVMVPMMKAMPGMAADTSVAAQRYLDATTWPADATGNFYASAPKKVTGPLFRVVLDHVLDRKASAAAWQALASATGADTPTRAETA